MAMINKWSALYILIIATYEQVDDHSSMHDFSPVHSYEKLTTQTYCVDHSYERLLIIYDQIHNHVIMNTFLTPT